MAYCTQADIEKTLPAGRLADLTDDSGGGSTSTPILSEQIAFADSLINSYIRGKHPELPLSPVPPMVRRWSVILTIQNCFDRRTEINIPEPFLETVNRIKAEMAMVRDGELLIDDADAATNSAELFISNKTEDSRIFTTNDSQTGVIDQYFSKNRILPDQC